MTALSHLVKRRISPAASFASSTRTLSTNALRLSLATRAFSTSLAQPSSVFASPRPSLSLSSLARAPHPRNYASMSAGAQVIDGNAVAL